MASKLGRNDPCWCGSGKKYKRCHLDADRATGEDNAALVHRDLLTEYLRSVRAGAKDFAVRAMAPANAAHQRMLARIGDGLAGKDAAFALRDHIAELEDAMKPLLSAHNRPFWLQLARRWPSEPIGDSRPWTVELYRRVFHLAVLKHGATDRPDEMIRIPLSEGAAALTPGEISEEDVLALGAVEYLAYELNHAASAFRRVGKGAELRVVNDDLRAVAGDDLQDLMELLDARVSKYGTLAGPYGAAVNASLPIEKPEDAPLIALDLVVNAVGQSGDGMSGFANMRFERPPNFAPHPVALDETREALLRFDAEMTDLIGVSPDALLATIHGLSIHTLTAMREDARIAAQLFTAAYLPMSWGEHYDGVCKNVGDWVRHWWKTKRGEEIGHEEATKVARDAFAALTYTEMDIEEIDLWARTPLRLVIGDDQRALFDFEAIYEVLAGLFVRVGFIPGDPGSVKGTAFEQELNRIAAEHGFKPWRTGIVRISDGRSREIDASFIVGRALFLVECKAFSQNPRIELGDYAALQNRWSTLHDTYLDQARTLRDFVRDHRDDERVAVPKQIDTFEYALCTPGVEWIPSRDPELWLTEEVPRICTPAELMQRMESLRAAL